MKTKATTANSLSNEKTEDITISELFEYWLMAEKDGSDISKPRNFFLYYKSYLAEPFGKRKVNDISHEEWKEYKQKLSNTHDTWEDEITAAISQRILDSFGKAFSYGHKESTKTATAIHRKVKELRFLIGNHRGVHRG